MKVDHPFCPLVELMTALSIENSNLSLQLFKIGQVSVLKSQKNKRLKTIKEEQSQKVQKMGKNPKNRNKSNQPVRQHIPMWPPLEYHPYRGWEARNRRRGNPVRRPKAELDNFNYTNNHLGTLRISTNGVKRAIERHKRNKQQRISNTQRIYLEQLYKNDPKEYKKLVNSHPLVKRWDEYLRSYPTKWSDNNLHSLIYSPY